MTASKFDIHGRLVYGRACEGVLEPPIVEIDVKQREALIVWADDGTEEWAYLSDMKRWIDVE